MREDNKYREMLLNTGAEEIGHTEMLATAVALNLENAPLSAQEETAADPEAGAVLNGMNLRHVLSAGLAALPVDASGVPFDMSHIYASGNIAADMYANVTTEATGRTLAVRLYNMTNDPGMQEMLGLRDRVRHHASEPVARGDRGTRRVDVQVPIPNRFPQERENQNYNYVYLGFTQTAPSRRADAGPGDHRSTATARSRSARWSLRAGCPTSARRANIPARRSYRSGADQRPGRVGSVLWPN